MSISHFVFHFFVVVKGFPLGKYSKLKWNLSSKFDDLWIDYNKIEFIVRTSFLVAAQPKARFLGSIVLIIHKTLTFFFSLNVTL